MQESDKRKPGQDAATSAAALSPDAVLSLGVTRDILSLGTRMAAALGISVPDDKWPTVIVSSSAQTSSYSPTANSITIRSNDVNLGSTYAEEVTHFLKCITTPPPLDHSPESGAIEDYKRLQELCGRLGRDFAMRMSVGTDLEHLFVGTSTDDGEALSNVVHEAASKLEGVQLHIDKQILALNQSVTLLTDLKDHLDRTLDTEWRADTEVLPEATVLLKQRVGELITSTATPLCTLGRLQTIREFVEPKTALTPYEVQQVLDVIRTGRNSDESLALRLTLQSSLVPLAIADAEIHGQAYAAAEELMRKHPDTWPEHFKKMMHLSLEEARDPKGYLASM